MDHRLPGAANALRLFPEQAATLAMFDRLGLSEAKMAAAVYRLAAASEQATAEWSGFFKIAQAPVPAGAAPTLRPPASLGVTPRPSGPAAPLGTPTVPARGTIIPGYSPAKSEQIRLSSMGNKVLRESGEHDADLLNQFLGTTTRAVQTGQQAQSLAADVARERTALPTTHPDYLDPANPNIQAAIDAHNPMAPSRDLMSSQDAEDVMNRRRADESPFTEIPKALWAARRGIGQAAMAGPRAMAGAVSLPFAVAADATRMRDGRLAPDWRHARGAVVDATGPLSAGLGINPLGNNGERSLYGDIMPEHARAATIAAGDAQSPTARVVYRTLAAGAQNAELAAGVTGATMLKAPGFLANLPRASLLPLYARMFAGPGLTGFQGVTNALEEGKAGPAPDMSLGSYTAKVTANDYSMIPPQAPKPGLGDNPAMRPASASPAPAPPLMPPEQARADFQMAHEGIVDLQKNVASGVMTPEQAHGAFARNADSMIDSHAAVTGQDPAQLKALVAKHLEDGKLEPDEMRQLQAAVLANPATKELADQQARALAQAHQGTGAATPQPPGTTPPAQPDFTKDPIGWFSALPWTQQAGLALGLPLAVLGIGQSLFGEGGLGSMLMAVLGGGFAAHGLGLGGDTGPLSGLNLGSLGDLFGGGGTGQGGAPPVSPHSPADPYQEHPVLTAAMADQQINPAERANLMRLPGLRDQLYNAPTTARDSYIRAMLAGDPSGFGTQMARAHAGMQGNWLTRNATRAVARAQGVLPHEFDAALDSYSRVKP